MNADSGSWSHLPSQISSKLWIVSASGVILPALPVRYLGHEERLRQKTLDASGTVHDELVVFAQLVNPKNGDDVLQLAIPLQCLLHARDSNAARRRTADQELSSTRPTGR